MKIELNTLKGLEKVSGGYFWDTVENALYSNKTGSLHKLSGSYQSGVRRYTVQYKNQHKMFPNHALNLRKDTIMDKVRLMNVVGSNSVGTAKVQAPQRGWIIGSVAGGTFSLASTPKIHTTEFSVNEEIERLAKVNPGKMFVKLKVEGCVVAGGVQWV